MHHVILDRDGVLNVEPDGGWIRDRTEWRWERGAELGLALLARPDILVSVATNQSGVGRGLVDEAELDRLHEWLRGELEGRGVRVVGIFACVHAPAAGCRCRKPAPGLILDAVAQAALPKGQTVVIGDAQRDLDAASSAGVASMLVRTGKGARTAAADAHDDLAAAVRALTARWVS